MPIFNELEPREVSVNTAAVPFVDPNVDPIKLALALYDKGAQFPLRLVVSPDQIVPIYTWISSPLKHPNLSPEQNRHLDPRQSFVSANTEVSYTVTDADYHPETREDKHTEDQSEIDPNTNPEVQHNLAVVSYTDHGLERSVAERLRAVIILPMPQLQQMASVEAAIKFEDLDRQRIRFTEFYPADGPALARYDAKPNSPGNMNGLWIYSPSLKDYLNQINIRFYLNE